MAWTCVEIAPSRRRCMAGTVFAAALATIGHVLGAGGLPSACWVLPAVLGVSTLTTASAAWSSCRRRRCGEAVALLWLGQFGAESIAVSGGGGLTFPMAAITVHVIAGLAIGVVLLGGRRLVDDTFAALDVLLPLGWRASFVATRPEVRWLISAPSAPPVACASSTSICLRGPPVLA